jgi:hypothetical protein
MNVCRMSRPKTRMLNRLKIVAPLGLLLACRSIPVVPAVAAAETLGPAPPLAGEWRLALRDTLRGRRAVGTLVLRATAHPDTATAYPAGEPYPWGAGVPFEGYARIDVHAAGAVTWLDPASTDPRFPGAIVTVYLSPATRPGTNLTRRAQLVLGGTRRDNVVQTDGESLEMVIQRWSRDTIAGTWESTSCPCNPQAAGYFIAVRSP